MIKPEVLRRLIASTLLVATVSVGLATPAHALPRCLQPYPDGCGGNPPPPPPPPICRLHPDPDWCVPRRHAVPVIPPQTVVVNSGSAHQQTTAGLYELIDAELGEPTEAYITVTSHTWISSPGFGYTVATWVQLGPQNWTSQQHYATICGVGDPSCRSDRTDSWTEKVPLNQLPETTLQILNATP
jgi:hypothetical protein